MIRIEVAEIRKQCNPNYNNGDFAKIGKNKNINIRIQPEIKITNALMSSAGQVTFEEEDNAMTENQVSIYNADTQQKQRISTENFSGLL